jgi:hypothetical protein
MNAKWKIALVVLFLVAGLATTQAPAALTAGSAPAAFVLPVPAALAPVADGSSCFQPNPCSICCPQPNGIVACHPLCEPV